MASGTDRFALYEMMREAWGEPLATALTEQIPPMASSDIATKQDVDNLAVQLRGEMSELRGELRGEMSELRGELRGETTALRGELLGQFAELRGEFAELRGEFRASSRHTLVTIIAAAVSIWLSFYLPAVL